MNCKDITLSALFLMIASGATAATLTTSIGLGADTFVTASSAATNFGTAEVIGIKRDTALGNSRKGYLRFDISSILGVASDASIELSYAGTNNDRAANPSTYSVYGLNDGHPQENWSESDITWSNAPGNITNSTHGFAADETTFLGTFNIEFGSPTIGEIYSFSSPSFVEFINADSNKLISILLSRAQANFSIEYFYTKENTEFLKPTLTISSVPMPAPFYLFSSGIFALFVMKRKRMIKAERNNG